MPDLTSVLLLAADAPAAAQVVVPENHAWVQAFFRWYAQAPWVGLLVLGMAIDVLMGVIVAGFEWHLNSKTSFAGMMKKSAMLIVVGLAAVIEQMLILSIPQQL